MARHDFELPDELGWKCNDEVGKYLDKWQKNFIKYGGMAEDTREMFLFWEVSKAELMDNVYAIIKKWQKKIKK